MKMSDLIGYKLVAVTEPWDDDLEAESVRLVFEQKRYGGLFGVRRRSILVEASDNSEPGQGGCVSVCVNEEKEKR